ncbi:PPK2 family polyphosphate kinase [Olsenella sp. HMSC062G07]|uniref:PPK2 family polyphosphate kinase n=1 Tax=Olsenella sp. HMSC062G07 TaxID=1739330 RepID=UPI0008A44742|nr:PPK2 family polyphosphate kinase [Olsenella sp. HMSC062G07]OFK23870.1 hypothetical protein HMPREF2826_03720 [Olsenella sp. HMSC062G07]
MNIKDFRFEGKGRFSLDDVRTSLDIDKDEEPRYEELTAQNTLRMGELQDKLYAEGREGLVILLQAMDAAGKDSTIKRVMSGVNPQGVVVHSFKQPSQTELAHDYLWRAVTHLPPRGFMGLFNRSYYEDVLVVRVHDIWKGYAMPKRCLNDGRDTFFERRYKQIANFEEYLYDNGYRVLKIFLNVGLDEQKERFLERIDNERKNWKFSAGDIDERELWPHYMDAYERAINATATEHAPWYVVPADQKWFARWVVSEAIVDVLEQIDPHYPELPKEAKDTLARSRERLTGEGR